MYVILGRSLSGQGCPDLAQRHGDGGHGRGDGAAFKQSRGSEERSKAEKRFYASLYAAFPDLRHRIVEQVCAGDQVVTRWTATGTHRAEWMGVQPTRKRVAFTGINIYTIRRGKFVASHVNWDTLGILQQIGTARLRLRVPVSPSRAQSAR